MKLKSLISYCELIHAAQGMQYSDKYHKIMKYIKFLKMRLKFGMFIPCDINDNPMDPPIECKCENGYNCKVNCDGGEYAILYKEAQDRIIFDCDFDYSDPWNRVMVNDGEPTIEYLAEMKHGNWKLTDNAVKRLL